MKVDLCESRPLWGWTSMGVKLYKRGPLLVEIFVHMDLCERDLSMDL